MKRLICLFIVVLSIQSCVIKQDTSKTEKSGNTSNSKYIEKALIKDGYQLGIVKVLEDSTCRYVIFNESTKINLDPINFNISDFVEFRKKDVKVYFKYKPLRMMNRCNDASPIELVSVVKREN